MYLQGEIDESRKRVVVCVFLMAWLLLRVAAQTSSTMMLNSATSTLRSENGHFKAGFISVNPSAPAYTMGIWYDYDLADLKVVWVASRSMALNARGSLDVVATDTVATLWLSAQGDLQAFDNNDTPPKLVWRSNTENKNVVSASIEDTGNLVLRTAANQTVWQSFDSPTDTLLPGQRFSADSAAKNLTAWATAVDWSEGNYSLAWRTDRQNVLEASWQNPYPRVADWSERQTYYWQLNGSSEVATKVARLTPDGFFQDGNTLARLTLDPDGNVRIYSWSLQELNWIVEWKALDNKCDIHGYCGPYSICNVNAVCECPEKFQFVDKQDQRLGCQPKESAAYCNATGRPRDAFVQVTDVNWFYNDLGTAALDVDNETCLRRCFESCDCHAAIFDTGVTNSKCWQKKDVLLNGRAGVNTSSFLRTCSCPDMVPTSGPKSRTLWILVGISGGALVVAMTSWGFYLYSRRQHFLYPADKAFQARLRSNGRNCVAFSEAMINSATENYKTLLGRGGFGDVFYGKLPDGTEVAVKVLSAMSQQSKQEFYNEIELLSKVHQIYVVSLLGYSCTRKHQTLIYEFLSGGNLRQRLQGGVVTASSTASSTAVNNRLKVPDPLTWQQRTRIILHVAEGLEYLHHKCSPPIIHRDIKSSNILLTSNMIAKVADFGLSKLKTVGNEDATHVTTVVKGTRGYLDPDYQLTGMLTEKSDVYSFGVVLLEILTGQNHIYIVQRVHDAWNLKQFEDIADPNVREAYDTDELINLVELALWCTRLGSTERPSMDQVVRRLHEILLPPLDRPT